MALDPSIPLQAKAPEFNPLTTALQVGQLRLINANGGALQQQIDANRATSAAYQQATDPNTGQVDNNKLLGILSQDPRAAYNLPQIMKGIQDYKKAQQDYDKGAVGLNNDQIDNYKKAMGFMSQQFATLDPNDPNFNAKLLTIGSDAVKLGHIDPNMVVSTMQQVPQDPAQRAMWFKQKLNAMQDFTAQLNNMKPEVGSVSTGGGTTFYNKDPLTGQVTPTKTIKNTLPIGERQTVSQDAKGNPVVTTKDENGSVTNVSGAPVQGQPPVHPQVIPDTETKESFAALQAARDQANAAAGQVQQQHFNNRAIIDILDKDHLVNPTGSNSEWLTKVSSTIGLPMSGKFAEDSNQIAHYLALQKQANEKAMGVNTDAGRATAGAASGTTTMDPASLRKAVAINDASAAGLASYNEGQEAAVQKGGIPALRSFQNAWSKYYDVNAMRLLNADRNGDQKEAQDVINSLGGAKSAKFQQMRKNAAALDQLKHGIIPTGGE